VILRGVIYTDQPRSLNAPEKAIAKPQVSVVSSAPLAVAQVAIGQMEMPQDVLSLDEVKEWLSSQDRTTRLAIASTLVDEIEQVKADAAAEARVAGANAAKAEVNRQYASMLDTLRAMTLSGDKLIEQHCEELSHQCASIVGEALSKLVGPAIVQPDACLQAVRAAVAYVRGARGLTVRVSEQDEAMLKAVKGQIAEAFGGGDLSIVADSRVTSGGCLIESSFGDIDARWETKLRSLINVLREATSSKNNSEEIGVGSL